MDFLINVVLPLSLAVIMLSLGVGLTVADFRRVVERPAAFAIGALAQVVAVPLMAVIVIAVFGLGGEIAVGFVLLALCPGGVTSNMISRLARADVALSVSLTAVVSLLSIVTVPVLAALAVQQYMGAEAPAVSVTELAVAMFLITTLPVAIGVALRHVAPGFAGRIDRPLSVLATGLFVLIVLAALAGNWGIFIEQLPVLGPALIVLNIALMLLGLGLARRLARPTRHAISIEVGVQNATLGITMAALITGVSTGFSTMALPAAVYGITMYLVALPFVLWFRRNAP